jgi:hypothetical protein
LPNSGSIHAHLDQPSGGVLRECDFEQRLFHIVIIATFIAFATFTAAAATATATAATTAPEQILDAIPVYLEHVH